jgi:hypothetical protein
MRTLTFDYGAVHSRGPFSARLIAYVIVAAGLYGMSRLAVPPRLREHCYISYLHSFAATGLMAWLAASEVKEAWLAAAWVVMAFALAVADRKLRWDELPFQAHLMALMALGRALIVNLHTEAQWRFLSVRLLSTAVVVVTLYALTRVVYIPERWRKQDLHHAYSWAASVLTGLLIWHELNATGNAPGVAVAYALFGLVLFEYGMRRQIRQFRLQAYVVLAAAFVRIFFSNLEALSNPTQAGLQLWLLLAIAAIFFYVYWQVTNLGKDAVENQSRISIADLLGWVATGTVVAILYYRLSVGHGEWVAPAWAAVVALLLAGTLATGRELFLRQAVVLTAGVLARSLLHEVYNNSIEPRTLWLSTATTVVLLLLGLPLAFRLRQRFGQTPAMSEPSKFRRALVAAIRQPEYVLFFSAVLLVTLLLQRQMQHGLLTMAWGVEGFLIFVCALPTKVRAFRLTGIAILLLSVGKIVTLDIVRLVTSGRWTTFLITMVLLGAVLMMISFLYGRFRETIRQLL